MLTIYDELLERVQNGERFSINFPKRHMKVGKEYLIKDGKCADGRILYGRNPVDIKYEIEKRYNAYKHSTPSERNDSKTRGYFKALSVDELTDAEMVCGENREVTQAELEGYILCAILMNHLKWECLTDRTYYWQSQNDKDLIILRQWVEGR